MITEKTTSLSMVALGFSNVKINDPETILKQLRSKLNGLEVQVLRGDRVAGNEHLSLAASHVSQATKQGRRRSKSLAMEFLLYTSGQRQITKAILRVGVTRKTSELVVIVCTDQTTMELDEQQIATACIELIGGIRNDSVIDIHTQEKIHELRIGYNITDREFDAARFPNESTVETLKRLVVERSALLTID